MLVWYEIPELAQLEELEEKDIEWEDNEIRYTTVEGISDQSTVVVVVFGFFFLGIDARSAPAHCKYNIYHH